MDDKKVGLTATDWLHVSMALLAYLFASEFIQSSVNTVQIYMRAKRCSKTYIYGIQARVFNYY
jgi:hypothetical protein